LHFCIELTYISFDTPQAPKTIADKVIENMKKKYRGKPTFFITEPCEGARVLTLPE
jgi:hypothetical protein